MQIALFASQAVGTQADLAVQQITTVNQKKNKPPQPRHYLKQSEEHGKNGNLRHGHVKLHDELSRPFTRVTKPGKTRRNKSFVETNL